MIDFDVLVSLFITQIFNKCCFFIVQYSSMQNPSSFYNQQLEKHLATVSSLKKKLLTLSTLRLIVFLATGFGIYVFFGNWQIAALIAVVGIGIFIYLVSKYTDIQAEKDLASTLVSINKEEIKIDAGEFHHRDTGQQYQNPNHFYSLDIDLFERGSFFQYLNRTSIVEGSQKLADELTANSIKDIVKRQDAIKELSLKPEWRQHFEAVATLVHVETPASKIINWLKSYKAFLPKYMSWLPQVFTLTTIIIIVLAFLKIINPLIVGYWLLIGLGITGIYVKKISVLSSNSDRVKDTFRQYAQLLFKIENESFTSELLQEKQKQIQSENKKASTVFQELSKHLDALDNRNNLISAILGNGFLLWDIMQSYKIEAWITEYTNKVDDWFEVVSFFDAYNSLGNYAFNHPSYVYPEILGPNDETNVLELGHPLLEKTKRVDNDLTIKQQQFFIITGANMAGKSTFLRTVSLHIVMANVGLPVCAKKSVYSPVKLITSMRTSDSLTDDSSYFFSELTRLKFIVDEIAKEPYFIVLDEILKGTNSTDKAIGSRKFVEKLVATDATGIIATHDLSLCEISKELDKVQNYYFDAEIINDELHFDYTFKEGICQNMNASFLLKKMNIV